MNQSKQSTQIMKKFLRKTMLCLSMASMTFLTTSCENLGGILNEDTISILAQLLSGIFQKGEANNYQGTASCQYLYGTYSATEGFHAEGQTDIKDITCTVLASNTNGFVTVQFPAITLTHESSTITMNDVVINNMALDAQGNLAIGENTTINGTIVAPDGNTYKFVDLYVGSAAISSEALTFNGSLYFGEDYKRVMNIKFSGAIVVAQ